MCNPLCIHYNKETIFTRRITQYVQVLTIITFHSMLACMWSNVGLGEAK